MAGRRCAAHGPCGALGLRAASLRPFLRPGAHGRPADSAAAAPRSKVAVLLPLTGQNAALGQSLLNAAQLALFEQGEPGFEFLPRDTGGTAAGAAEAARAAMAEGARVIVGPLTAQETAAVASPARAAGVPMLPFTNDGSRAAQQVWPLGITPAQQVRRVVAAANAQGVRRFALAAPNGALGRQMAEALRGAASDLGLPAPVIETYPAAAAPGVVAVEVARRIGATDPDAPAESRTEMLLLGESGARARDFAAGLASAGAAMPPLRRPAMRCGGMTRAWGSSRPWRAPGSPAPTRRRAAISTAATRPPSASARRGWWAWPTTPRRWPPARCATSRPGRRRRCRWARWCWGPMARCG
ncbi:penicillin-binding protein activator [Teichococcus aestuarii]|uniref:penicillin-binding protein activator n=1 Tax=Teichococcus aestuarii TaxID=568898 RepID=UPI0036157AE0